MEIARVPIIPPIRPPRPSPVDPTESPSGNGSLIGGPEGEQMLAVTYEIVLPIIATIGLFGHVCSLVVLSRTKFHGFIFTYLKAMAVVDALYLLYCVQACYFVSMHYMLTERYKYPTSYGLAVYVWHVISPVWNMFAGVSDYIVVFMTLDRCRIMRNIDTVRHHRPTSALCANKTAAVSIVVAVVISVAMNLPACFQFRIVECNSGLCYAPREWLSAEESWDVYCYVYEVVMKLIPYFLIVTLNALILLKLRVVWRQRKLLRASGAAGAMASAGVTSTSSPSSRGSVATISLLVLKPPQILGAEASSSECTDEDVRIKQQLRSRCKEAATKPARRVLLSLPSKASRKEMHMTGLLMAVVLSHVVLTLPESVCYFAWTVFPTQYQEMPNRAAFECVADILVAVNYSISFYLYCAANSDIRAAVSATLAAACCACAKIKPARS